ncbi:MAG: DUF1573 domain-containing protein [Bacteroidales bacterium]|nr:DUF1573 domain-containing protein [Bacteroidales bacterium]
MKLLLIILSILIGGRAEFDKTVHDFGTITQADGPQKCVFTITNKGDEPLTILSAISSCGCTNVRWTRSSLAKGEKGQVEATFTNEDGPFPFDKTITVYLSDIKKPVVLHLRGVVK